MQASNSISQQLILEPEDNIALANFVGELNGNLKIIEKQLQVKIFQSGNIIKIEGDAIQISKASKVMSQLYAATHSGELISKEFLTNVVSNAAVNDEELETVFRDNIIKTPKKTIKPRSPRQQEYLNAIDRYEINFGIGPAGTGKTYLAVAKAVEYLLADRVQKIILIRPAVEAGEKLGFLPGDLSQKVDPYLRPLYDALYEMIGYEKVVRMIERDILEVAPLAYLRGRTLNNAFIIMDESQNTTTDQMKMFLTRMGFGSYAIINGDTTQIDLPKHVRSGLNHAQEVLKGVEGIGFTYLTSKDVVRHPLVRKIVDAYNSVEQDNK
ncbi:MAG: PhoH family protein [Gammaproteobacteria bacterium]